MWKIKYSAIVLSNSLYSQAVMMKTAIMAGKDPSCT